MLIGSRAAENKNRKLTDISLAPTKCVHAASAFLKSTHGCLSITIRLVAQARLTALRCLLTRTHASKTTRVFAPTRDVPVRPVQRLVGWRVQKSRLLTPGIQSHVRKQWECTTRLNSTAAICSKGLRVNNSRRRDCDVRGLSELPAIKSDTAGEENDEGRKEEGRKAWNGGRNTRVEGDRGRPPTALDAYLRYIVPFARAWRRAVSIRHGADSSACGKESRLVRICMQIASRIPVARQTARHGNQFCGLAAVIECGVNK